MRTRAPVRSVIRPVLLNAARWIRAKRTGSRTLLPVWWDTERLDAWQRAFERPRSLGTTEYAQGQATQHLHSHNVHVSFAYVARAFGGWAPKPLRPGLARRCGAAQTGCLAR